MLNAEKSRFLSEKKLIVVLLLFVAMSANAQWVSYPLPYDGIANTLGFYDLNNGLSFGYSFSNTNLYIYRTTNSGINWNLASYPPELRVITDIQFINSTTAYASGAENLLPVRNYNPVNNFLSLPKNLRIKYLREGRSEFNITTKGAFIKTTDGGANWQRASTFDTLKGYINDIHFFNVNTGYALIDSNAFGYTNFYKTTNGGANWIFVQHVDNTQFVDKMIFFDMNTGIAKGYNYGGKIYKTTNAGLNWVRTNMPLQIDCITFYNSTTGIAFGLANDVSSNTIYKTTNAGDNWNVLSVIAGSKQYNDLMTIPNTGTSFAVGYIWDTIYQTTKLTTLKTTNYGANWVSKDFNSDILTSGIALIDANNFFISGGNVGVQAQILKSTNGGNVFVNQTGSEIPSSYSLSQNYPNPFNPTTTIKFTIPKVSSPHGFGGDLVLLKIFDVSGREVETLVNEQLQPGTYSTQWNASAYCSGVYFYKITAGDFSETKRMLLIK